MAPSHLAAAENHPEAKVTHIADVRIDCARALADEYGIESVSNNPEKLLADDNVDTVVVILPTFLHFKWLMRSAAAGKHIVCEKPFCRTVSQGRRVIRACAENRVRLAVGYQRRFSPARIKVREIVQSGEIGCPVTWTLSTYAPRPDWHAVPAARRRNEWVWDTRSGGLVMDWSIHAFDFACWVLGDPVKMFAQSRRLSDVVTSPTQASAIVHFENGDNLVYGASWQEGDFGVGGAPESIVGPKGTIVLEADMAFTWHHASGKKKEYRWDQKDLEPHSELRDWDYMLYKMLESFLDRKENDPCLTTGEAALPSLWMAEKIIASGPNGRTFRFV